MMGVAIFNTYLMLPAGSAGTAAIYTEHLKPTHVVRRVILRQLAIINYVNPF